MFTCDDVHLMKRIPPRSVANDLTVSRIFLLLITAAIITRCY